MNVVYWWGEGVTSAACSTTATVTWAAPSYSTGAIITAATTPMWTGTTAQVTVSTNWADCFFGIDRVPAKRLREIRGAPFVPRKKTEAEIQAELRYVADKQRQAAEDAARRVAAKARAEKLLLANLRPEQRESLLTMGCFYLLTKSGRRYRIERGTHGNVKLVDEAGRELERLCAQPNGVPTDDAVLAQKLALETDEEGYRRVANITPYR